MKTSTYSNPPHESPWSAPPGTRRAMRTWQQAVHETRSATRTNCAGCSGCPAELVNWRPEQADAVSGQFLAVRTARVRRPHAAGRRARPAAAAGAPAGRTELEPTCPADSATIRSATPRPPALPGCCTSIDARVLDGNNWRLRRPLPLLLSPAFSLYDRGATITRRLGSRRSAEIAADRSRSHEVILSGGDPLTLVDAHAGRAGRAPGGDSALARLRIHTRLPIMIPERVDATS